MKIDYNAEIDIKSYVLTEKPAEISVCTWYP